MKPLAYVWRKKVTDGGLWDRWPPLSLLYRCLLGMLGYLMKLKTEPSISHQWRQMTPLNLSPVWHKDDDEEYFQPRKGKQLAWEMIAKWLKAQYFPVAACTQEQLKEEAGAQVKKSSAGRNNYWISHPNKYLMSKLGIAFELFSTK